MNVAPNSITKVKSQIPIRKFWGKKCWVSNFSSGFYAKYALHNRKLQNFEKMRGAENSLVLSKIQFPDQKCRFHGSTMNIKGVMVIFLPHPKLVKKIKLFSVLYGIFKTQKVEEKIYVFCTKAVQCCSLGSVRSIFSNF